MNKSTFIACLTVIATLGIGGMVQGAAEPASQSNPVVAQNDQADNRDLLMFFEEQDLVCPDQRGPGGAGRGDTFRG